MALQQASRTSTTVPSGTALGPTRSEWRRAKSTSYARVQTQALSTVGCSALCRQLVGSTGVREMMRSANLACHLDAAPAAYNRQRRASLLAKTVFVWFTQAAFGHCQSPGFFAFLATRAHSPRPPPRDTTPQVEVAQLSGCGGRNGAESRDSCLGHPEAKTPRQAQTSTTHTFPQSRNQTCAHQPNKQQTTRDPCNPAMTQSIHTLFSFSPIVATCPLDMFCARPLAQHWAQSL